MRTVHATLEPKNPQAFPGRLLHHWDMSWSSSTEYKFPMRRAPSWPFTRALASDSGTTRGGGYLGDEDPEAQAVTLLPRGGTGQGRSPALSGPRAYSSFCPRRDNRCEGVLSSAKRGNCKTTQLRSVTHHTEDDCSGRASSLCSGEDRRRLRRASVATLHPYVTAALGEAAHRSSGAGEEGSWVGREEGFSWQGQQPSTGEAPGTGRGPQRPCGCSSSGDLKGPGGMRTLQ